MVNVHTPHADHACVNDHDLACRWCWVWARCRVQRSRSHGANRCPLGRHFRVLVREASACLEQSILRFTCNFFCSWQEQNRAIYSCDLSLSLSHFACGVCASMPGIGHVVSPPQWFLASVGAAAWRSNYTVHGTVAARHLSLLEVCACVCVESVSC